jgi:hypothetical protein
VGEVGLDGCGYVGEDVPRLLPPGPDQRQHRLDEPTAALALRAEGQLPPDDRVPQRPLAGIVRGLDLPLQKRPQPRPLVVQLAAHAHQARVTGEKAKQFPAGYKAD